MILDTLPKEHTHLDLFFNYKRDTEYLGISKFYKNELDFGTFSYLLRLIDNFFTKGIYIDDIDILFNEDKELFREHFEGYTKLCWLAYEFIENNYNFKNLIGVHYNPQKKLWNIHPGSSRQIVLNYFGPDTIEAVAFNTGGIEKEFDIIFENKTQLKKYFQKDFTFVCCAEYGSIIPHLHLDQGILSIKTLEWAKKVQKFWRNTNVVGSVRNMTTQHNSKDKEVTLRLKLKNDNDLIKGLILLPSYNKFKKHGVRIENVTS
jgi:hypothetical protein